MDYEKKYKEALERAKGYLKEYYFEEAVKDIFPELAGSEDERIKEDIISYIQLANQFIPQFQKDKWLAWLEKQGEQKSAWSEEDEMNLEDSMRAIKCSNYFDFESAKENVLNWLKSLKERYTWKPSDEQMEALDDFIYAKYPNIEKYGAAVKSLYQDLKKLREDKL